MNAFMYKRPTREGVRRREEGICLQCASKAPARAQKVPICYRDNRGREDRGTIVEGREGGADREMAYGMHYTNK